MLSALLFQLERCFTIFLFSQYHLSLKFKKTLYRYIFYGNATDCSIIVYKHTNNMVIIKYTYKYEGK